MPDARKCRATRRPRKPVPPNTVNLLIPRSVTSSFATLVIDTPTAVSSFEFFSVFRLGLSAEDLAQGRLNLAAAVDVTIVLSRFGGQLGQWRETSNPPRQRGRHGRGFFKDRFDLV